MNKKENKIMNRTEDLVVLGENAIYSTDCRKTGMNNNVLVCGSTGCGKTMSVTEPRLLETYNTNLIVTVTKRRIVEKYADVFRERGYVVEDMNFVDMASSTIAFDPMQFIRNESDIQFLADSIVTANPRKNHTTADPFWDQMSSALLQAEIAYTRDMLGSKATLSDVLDLNDRLEVKPYEPLKTTFDTIFDDYELMEPDSFAVTCWKKFRALPYKTASSVIGTMGADINTMFSKDLRDMISKSRPVNFEEFASRKTILFLTTNPVNPSLNYFINIFYGQAFKSLFEYAEHVPGGKLPIPVHMICDDFATGSRIMNFAELISIFREKQISVTLLLQSESQLYDMYGMGAAKTIINNCDTYLYMGGMDTETVQNISVKVNEPFDDVLYMPIGEEILIRRGQRPIHVQRYDILKNHEYQRITAGYEKEIEGRRCNARKDSSVSSNVIPRGYGRGFWQENVLDRTAFAPRRRFKDIES